jgi:hypothetical protein
MRKGVVATFACLVVSLLTATPGAALPLSGFGAMSSEDALSPTIEARVFCYNRYTGRFKHWGACHASVPRIYCRSRYGEFLHWGSCNG